VTATTYAAQERAEAARDAIWETPARTEADVTLLAELCLRENWPGLDLTDADADAMLEGGPYHWHPGTDTALGSLLAAIRDVLMR
jgi:hypothetical protein